MSSKLFAPIKLRELELANRVVVAPMCQYSAENGNMTDWHMLHLGSLSNSGAGLLIVEATGVEPEGRISLGDTSLYDDAQQDAWSRIAAFFCVWLLAAILLYLMWWEPEGDSDFVFRVIGILSILIAAFTVITPVFHKLSSSGDEAAEIDAEIEKLRAKIEELEMRKAKLNQPET